MLSCSLLGLPFLASGEAEHLCEQCVEEKSCSSHGLQETGGENGIKTRHSHKGYSLSDLPPAGIITPQISAPPQTAPTS